MIRCLARLFMTARRAAFFGAAGLALLAAASAASAAEIGNRDAVLREIADKTAHLAAPTRTVELTWEKAKRVTQAIHDGDYGTAHRIIVEVRDASRLTPFRYHPFSEFMDKIADTEDGIFEDRLNDWVLNGSDAVSLLARAQYYYNKAWAVRGGEFANKTSFLQLAGFRAYNIKALADINSSIDQDDKNPYSFNLKLKILQGYGLQPEMTAAFKEAIDKHPAYYWLYRIMLRTIDPRWGGTTAEMKSFVSHYADNAPDSSPLRALYISLYWALINDASSLNCSGEKKRSEDRKRCIAKLMQENVPSELEDKVEAALHLYDHVDKYEFSILIKDFLHDVTSIDGANAYAGTLLQLAGSAMHTETQNREDRPHDQNNFMIDIAVGDSWYQQEHYDEAKNKYLEALKHIGSMNFPNEEEKDLSVATIYDRLSQAAERQREYTDIIVYQQAAIGLDGSTGREHFICYSYYMLKLYEDAVRACTEAIDKQKNWSARYWRGESYVKLDRTDDALRDFEAVADQKKPFHHTAAIAMSLIYFKRNDMQAALDVLNKYPFLYDADHESKNSLAVAYNNRCYAYMELDQLQQALDDCTKSLQFGSLPEAYRKQQELTRRLKAQ